MLVVKNKVGKLYKINNTLHIAVYIASEGSPSLG